MLVGLLTERCSSSYHLERIREVQAICIQYDEKERAALYIVCNYPFSANLRPSFFRRALFNQKYMSIYDSKWLYSAGSEVPHSAWGYIGKTNFHAVCGL